MCQNLSADSKDKLERFQAFIKKAIEDNGIRDNHIINIKVPLTFAIPVERSVAPKGDKAVTIKTTDNEKGLFTVVLACCTDGQELSPILIFKLNTKPKQAFLSVVVIESNMKGWMDEEVMGKWFEKCFSK